MVDGLVAGLDDNYIKEVMTSSNDERGKSDKETI
jgi:hypothetical protein